MGPAHHAAAASAPWFAERRRRQRGLQFAHGREGERRSLGSLTLPLSAIDGQRIALDRLLVRHSKETIRAQSVTTPIQMRD